MRRTQTGQLPAAKQGEAAAAQKAQRRGQASLTDNRPEAAGQHGLQRAIRESSVLAAQRKFIDGINGAAQRVPEEEEEELLQGKFSVQRQAEEDEELLQGKFARSSSRDPQPESTGPVQRTATPTAPNHTGMPDEVKNRMETLHQTDFSQVRVHPDSSRAPAVGALAYTQGSDIHFAPGQFRPDSAAGRRLLGHELTHVVQQRQGKVKATTEVGGMPVNDDPSLEQEADTFGNRA